MKIADKIGMLEISTHSLGRDTKFYPTLIWNNNSALLIDAGLPGSMSSIKTAVENDGVLFESIETLIITHQDIDHFGGVRELVKELPGLKICAHKEDAPYIQGESEIQSNSNLMDRLSRLPKEHKEKMVDTIENSHVKVDNRLEDGEKLDCFGNIIVIHTPGHTPGHICLYHESSKTLIAGDALNIHDGNLVGPNQKIMTKKDAKSALLSLEKLDNYNIENVICYHGGLFNQNANQAIKELRRQ